MKKKFKIGVSIIGVYCSIFMITSIGCFISGQYMVAIQMLVCTILIISSTSALYNWEKLENKNKELLHHIENLEDNVNSLKISNAAYRTNTIDLIKKLEVEKAKSIKPNWCHPNEKSNG